MQNLTFSAVIYHILPTFLKKWFCRFESYVWIKSKSASLQTFGHFFQLVCCISWYNFGTISFNISNIMAEIHLDDPIGTWSTKASQFTDFHFTKTEKSDTYWDKELCQNWNVTSFEIWRLSYVYRFNLIMRLVVTFTSKHN